MKKAGTSNPCDYTKVPTPSYLTDNTVTVTIQSIHLTPLFSIEGITVFKFSFGEVYRQIYGQKDSFVVTREQSCDY